MAIKFVAGNQLRLLNSGMEYFPALMTAIDEAADEIWLETYIFANDPTGQAVAAGLARAARRGVNVRLLVDGFGARNFRADFADTLADAGVLTMEYRPEFGPTFKRHRLRRLHRKLALFDGRVAFVGGINIADDDNLPPALRPRYDYAVRAEGPVVADICKALHKMWEIVAWANLKHRYRLQHLSVANPTIRGTQQAAFLIRDNIRHRNDIARAYHGLIENAQHEILIASAYFLPGHRFRQVLRAAAARGVQIRILLQGQSDHPLLMYATQALYRAMIADGIEIYEYRKGFLHAKVAVVDKRWATVGSSNIDPFSLLMAKEGNLFVDDSGFSQDLQTSLENTMAAGAAQLRNEDMSRLKLHSRFVRWVCYGFVRLLVGLAGYGDRHWRADYNAGAEGSE